MPGNYQENIWIQMDIARRIPLVAARLQGKMKLNNALYHETIYQEASYDLKHSRQDSFRLPYYCSNCGRTEIQWEQLYLQDLLGLFRKPLSIPNRNQFVVYPKLLQIEVEKTNLPNASSVGEQYDPYRRGSDVTEVFGLRDYQPGDMIHSIHWKLSGKLGKLVIREFGHPSNYDTLLLYDTGVPQGGTDHLQQNAVLELAASLSYALLHLGHMHTMATISGHTLHRWSIEQADGYEEMLGEMMELPVVGENSNVMAEFIQGCYQQDYTKMIYVTTSFRERQIQELSRYMNITVVYISSHEEENLQQGINYQVIAIPADTLREKLRVVEI